MQDYYGQWLVIAGLPPHGHRNYCVTMAQSPCGFKPCLNGSCPTDTRHDPGLHQENGRVMICLDKPDKMTQT